MLQISEKQVEQTLNADSTIQTIKEAYINNSKGKIYMPSRVYMPVRGKENVGQWLIANDLIDPYFGTKFSSVFPNNRDKGLPVTSSQISLYSAEDGQLVALIDANYLTAIKTGGSAALATDLLAKKDAHVMAVIGSGFQAFAQVMMIQHVRHLSKVYVFDTVKARFESFASKVKKIQAYPFDIIQAKSADEAVQQADIICTCTPSHTPVFDGNKLKAGALVNAIGSFTPQMEEIDSTTVVRADSIFTEHVDGLWKAAGDILIPYKRGVITKENVTGSLADILTGEKKGRTAEDQIMLYESVGSGVLDIALAIKVYMDISKKAGD